MKLINRKIFENIFLRRKLEKSCPKEKRARQAKHGVALFCLVMYSFDVGSDLSVGFDLLNRCHKSTGNI